MAQYEWYTDPAGNKHFQRLFPKKGKKAAGKPVVETPVEVAAVEVVPEPVAVVAEGPKKITTRRAPAKKKSNG